MIESVTKMWLKTDGERDREGEIQRERKREGERERREGGREGEMKRLEEPMYLYFK